MNNGVLLFFGMLLAMLASWFGFVHSPQLQLGKQLPELDPKTGETFPLPRSGAANRGRDIYRQNGCVSCHTQQVRQKDYNLSVVADDWGTNIVKVSRALALANRRFNEGDILPPEPFTVNSGLNLVEAKRISDNLIDAGALVRRVTHPIDADIRRGWGFRRTVGRDYLLDQPVMLGTQRIGPDLSNIGNRRPDVHWHLLHLFQPRKLVKDSTMPSYSYLFERRAVRAGAGDPRALRHEGELVTDDQGRQIIPTAAASDLAAYLMSLRLDSQIFEAPSWLPKTNKTEADSNPGENETEQTE